MPKMFPFSRRKMRLGRVKSHQGDPLHVTRSPARPVRRPNQSNGENGGMTSVSGRTEGAEGRYRSDSVDFDSCQFDHSDNWTLLSTLGDKPGPRFNHAAAIIGNKMVVVGGDNGNRLLDDTRILSLDKLTWAHASPKVYLSPTGRSSKIPACKGHCLVPWGKTIILIGGKTEPVSERVSAWSFDIEAECWSHVEAKGDIPSGRCGHTVIRAGPVLILFGGENSKGKKLNDLHMFDLKSSTWLPLRYKGTGPSARSNHVATLYDDKTLFIFGGHSKSKTLNDLYSLDFETMVWSRIKTRGIHPSARAGCCGALSGNKWYIAGGGSKKKRRAETLVLDVSKYEWSEFIAPPSSSVTTNKGFSMVPLQQRDKLVLIAFGGNRKDPSDKVETLVLFQTDSHALSWRSAPDTDPSSFSDSLCRNVTRLYSFDSVARHSALDPEASGRRSFSDPLVPLSGIGIGNSGIGGGIGSGSGSLRKQFLEEEEEEEGSLGSKLKRSVEGERVKGSDGFSLRSSLFQAKDKTTHQTKISTTSTHHTESLNPLNPSEIYQLYESKISHLTNKTLSLESQLNASIKAKESIERDFSETLNGKEESERRLEETLKEVGYLKEKILGLEIAQDEANSLSNLVHEDNVKLEHDVAFLKAILDDTQKELLSTRGVLAQERQRSLQLQMEMYHLNQRMKMVENRAPTPRKPHN
ncbi:hypothetical protein LUZ60_015606 [Juncus effusus]|nr:hypothetical protein LUZ60_015606 [Juncus effusus]